MASSQISGQDKDCASYLLSLKHDHVSPTMTEDDMDLIIERTSSSNSVATAKSSQSMSTASSVMSVQVPEPLFRTEEEISPNAVNMCSSNGTHFSVNRGGSTFNSFFFFPRQHKPENQEPERVLLPKFKEQGSASVSGKKSRSKPLIDGIPPTSKNAPINKTPVMDLSDEDTLLNLVGDSDLVDLKDITFIPDYIFLSMAQLQPCFVTTNDRIGTYKNRKLGFKGMSCKHCGGEPGFGRYFPETLRSLSQTTTSQTIVKHIAYKCRKCPKEIRDSVKALKEQQDAKDQIAKEYRRSRFEERPKYGSRKVFFQRLWSRLHGDDSEDLTLPEEKKPKKKKHIPPSPNAKTVAKGKRNNSRRSWEDLGEGFLNTQPGQLMLSPRKRTVSIIDYK